MGVGRKDLGVCVKGRVLIVVGEAISQHGDDVCAKLDHRIIGASLSRGAEEFCLNGAEVHRIAARIVSEHAPPQVRAAGWHTDGCLVT